MDALELLKNDHQTVKELFEEAEGTEEQGWKEKIFDEIRTELETHASIEETVFYPAMEKHAELKDMVTEAIEEHKKVKNLIREIERLTDSDQFDAKLKELMENVEHHAEEEEEGKMFPKIREIVSQQELDHLGNKLEVAKNSEQRKAS